MTEKTEAEKLDEAVEALRPFAGYRGSDEFLKCADDESHCAAVSFKAGDYRRARDFLARYEGGK